MGTYDGNVIDAPGYVDENSASYLPDLSVIVQTTLYISYDFCCDHNIQMDCVPSTGNKILLTYLLTYFLTSEPNLSQKSAPPTAQNMDDSSSAALLNHA